MGHISTLEMTKEEWLAKRATTIGSSDVGAILGLNKYKSPLELYNEKKGLTPAFEGNDSTEWGTELEDFCARMFERKELGMVVVDAGVRVQRDNKIRVHPKYEWATCNLDRLITGGGVKPTILELKTTTSYAVEHWDAAIPTTYYAQLQWQMFVTGYKYAIIWVAVLDRKKFLRLNVDYDAKFCNAMLETVKEFANALDTNNPSNLKATISDVEKMVATPGSTVEATDEMKEKIAMLVSLKANKSELEKSEKALTQELKMFVGENEALVEGDRVLATYKTINKPAVSYPASTYRQFSIQREKREKK